MFCVEILPLGNVTSFFFSMKRLNRLLFTRFTFLYVFQEHKFSVSQMRLYTVSFASLYSVFPLQFTDHLFPEVLIYRWHFMPCILT